MVPAPVERSEVPGHRQRSPNSAALTVGALAFARAGRCGRCSERSAEFGSVDHARCCLARARGWAARCRPICSTCSGRLVGAAAAGRTLVRSPAAPFFLADWCSQIRGDDGARAVRPMMTSASPGRDGGDGAGAGRAQRGTGSSTTIAKFCSTDSRGACLRSRRALRPLLGKISGIWQR